MRAVARCGCRALVFLLAAVAFGCSDEGLERYDDSFCREALGKPGSVDAMEWLRISSSEPKHFGSFNADESLALVDRFDFAGAKRVSVVGTGLETQASDLALIVELPADPRRRLAVFEFYAKQVRNLGFRPMADLGQTYLYLPARP